MRCTIVLEFDDGHGTAAKRVELMQFHRAECGPCGDVGLTLEEGKSFVNCVQEDFVNEQIARYCASQRTCKVCGTLRREHDLHSSELNTTLGKVYYCRPRWKACKCGADKSRYVSPLKNFVREASTGELRWLHAELGARMPYRQAMQVMNLLLPTSGRDSHITIRNHTVAVGKYLQHVRPVRRWCEEKKPIAELGIDVGYVKRARNNHKGAGKDNRAEAYKSSSSIAVVVAALGQSGKQPRVWASAMPRIKRLHEEMTNFLEDSGYNDPHEICVVTGGARDLAGVADNLPFDTEWVLDWAHIGRMMRHVDQAIAPLAYGRLTPDGSVFELWETFIRFRSDVWTGQPVRWQKRAETLFRLLELRKEIEPKWSCKAEQARNKLLNLVCYLNVSVSPFHLAGWERL